ncbi:hypothetical protein [uncultured Microbulbifer sp.]|nr:hypothetical protein [uncultured Microbulbifer sp.]
MNQKHTFLVFLCSKFEQGAPQPYLCGDEITKPKATLNSEIQWRYLL